MKDMGGCMNSGVSTCLWTHTYVMPTYTCKYISDTGSVAH